MGTTLTNGVYLPNEGERNCYAGLKTNWEILDQKVADVTALQQAVAGALHRQIVTQLPTEDIDPNTIYMILSGTSATENVYNEFMYVNNAWELIGTSATDLTNYYTKAEVDGKLLLKASASDLTSHTGDTTIHVTTTDKNRWNNQTYVFRYSSTVLTALSTNSNTLLDNTDNLKVGDKVIDSSGVLFSITAIDTANSTFTIGTALIDLAQDSDVVHKSGNETIGGNKTFLDYITFSSANIADVRWKSLVNQTIDLNDCYITRVGSISGYYSASVSSGSNISNKAANTAFIMLSLTTRYISVSDYQIYQIFYGSNNEKYIRTCSNGTWTAWINEVDKFVTTDTNQAITGAKTFLDVPISFKSSTAELGVTGGSTKVIFTDKNLLNLAGITFGNYASSKLSYCRFHIYDKDSNNQEIENFIEFSYVNNNQLAYFRPNKSNFVTLGTVNNRWNKVYADEYYYGSNNVEFSTKFVTTDTTQTISGNKTFSSNVNVYNSDSSTDTANIVLKNSKVERGSTTNIGEQNISFVDKNNTQISNIKSEVDSNGVSTLTLNCTNSSNGSSGIRLRRTSTGTCLQPIYNNGCNLGTTGYRWYDVQTRAINSVEPSSLSLPSGNLNDVIDISSYLTNLDGTINTYTAPANGWISITMGNCSGIQAYITGLWGHQIVRPSVGGVRFLMPILKDKTANILIFGGTIDNARFIPCQGNV